MRDIVILDIWILHGHMEITFFKICQLHLNKHHFKESYLY